MGCGAVFGHSFGEEVMSVLGGGSISSIVVVLITSSDVLGLVGVDSGDIEELGERRVGDLGGYAVVDDHCDEDSEEEAQDGS